MARRTGIMVLILLATLLATVPQLNTRGLWFDETMTYFLTGTGEFKTVSVAKTPCATMPYTNLPTVGMLCLIAIDNSWPPAYFILYTAWQPIAQGNLMLGRLLSVYMGLIALCVMYQLGKLLISPRAGLIGALLLGSSAFVLFYFQEQRGYILFALSTLMALYFYWRLIYAANWRNNRLHWGFVLSLALTLYAHYIGLGVMFALGVYHVLAARPNLKIRNLESRRWWSIIRLMFNAGLLYTPWLGALIVSVANENIITREATLDKLVRGLGYGLTNNLAWLVIPLLLLSLRWWGSPAVRFLWIIGLGIFGFALIANAALDFLFHPRHLIVLMPIMALLWAYLADHYAERYPVVVWGIIGLWVGLGLVYSSNDGFLNRIEHQIPKPSNNALQTIFTTAQQCIPPDGLVTIGFTNAVRHDESTFSFVLHYYLHNYGTAYGLLNNSIDDATQLAKDIQGKNTIWVYMLPEQSPTGKFMRMDQALREAGYTNCGLSIQRADLVGAVYSHDAAACQAVLTCTSTAHNSLATAQR